MSTFKEHPGTPGSGRHFSLEWDGSGFIFRTPQNHLARTFSLFTICLSAEPQSRGLPHTCSDAGGGGSKDLPTVLGHDQQLHLLLGRRTVFLQDQEFTVLVQEVIILDACGTG